MTYQIQSFDGEVNQALATTFEKLLQNKNDVSNFNSNFINQIAVQLEGVNDMPPIMNSNEFAELTKVVNLDLSKGSDRQKIVQTNYDSIASYYNRLSTKNKNHKESLELIKLITDANSTFDNNFTKLNVFLLACFGNVNFYVQKMIALLQLQDDVKLDAGSIGLKIAETVMGIAGLMPASMPESFQVPSTTEQSSESKEFTGGNWPPTDLGSAAAAASFVISISQVSFNNSTVISHAAENKMFKSFSDAFSELQELLNEMFNQEIPKVKSLLAESFGLFMSIGNVNLQFFGTSAYPKLCYALYRTVWIELLGGRFIAAVDLENAREELKHKPQWTLKDLPLGIKNQFDKWETYSHEKDAIERVLSWGAELKSMQLALLKGFKCTDYIFLNVLLSNELRGTYLVMPTVLAFSTLGAPIGAGANTMPCEIVKELLVIFSYDELIGFVSSGKITMCAVNVPHGMTMPGDELFDFWQKTSFVNPQLISFRNIFK